MYWFWVDRLPGAEAMASEADAPRAMRLAHAESGAAWHVPLLRTDGELGALDAARAARVAPACVTSSLRSQHQPRVAVRPSACQCLCRALAHRPGRAAPPPHCPASPPADGMQLQPAALRPMFDQLGVQIDSSLLIELREEECSLAGGFVATVRLVGRRAPGGEGGRCVGRFALKIRGERPGRCLVAEAGQLLTRDVSATAARLFSVGPLPDLP